MKTFFVSGICYCLPAFLSAQSYDLWIANRRLTSMNTMEFDLMIRCHDSINPIPLKHVQSGYRFNPVFINGGSLTANYVPGSSEMEAAFGKTWGFSFNAAQSVLNQSANVGSVCPGALIGPEPRRVGRFRIINSVIWGCADDSMSFVRSGTGILRLAIVKYNSADCSDPNPVAITTEAHAFTPYPNNALLMARANLLPPSQPCDTMASVSITTTGGAAPYTGTGTFLVPSGSHVFRVTDARGCADSITFLSEPRVFETSFFDSACEKYVLPWGNVIIGSGSYSHTYITSTGCDSMVIAHIKIRQPSSGSDTASLWPSQLPFYWNGIACPGAGNYHTMLVNREGCDSAVSLFLQLLDSCSPQTIISSAAGDSICSGETVTLTVIGNPPAGGQWRWFANGCGAGSSIGRGSGIRVTPKNTTSYFVRSQGGDCGNTACASINIQVRNKPAVPGPITGSSSGLCLAQDISYSVSSVASSTNYQWHLPDGALISSGQGSDNISVNYSSQLSSNIFTSSNNICVRSNNNCGSSSCRNLSLSLRPSAAGTIMGPFSLVAGQTADYFSSVFGATGFNWSVPSGWSILSGRGTSRITVRAGSSNGYVKLTPSNACGTGTSGIQYISVAPVLARRQKEIEIYPNPGSGIFYLHASGFIPRQIQLMDMQGKVMLDLPWSERIDLSTLPVGPYLLKVMMKGGFISQRINILR